MLDRPNPIDPELRDSSLLFRREEINERVKKAQREKRENDNSHCEDKLLEELLKEKQRFTTVFQTEKESYYFILGDGSCLRIQKREEYIRGKEDGLWQTRPMADHLFFIESSVVDQLSDLREQPEFSLKKMASYCTIPTTKLKNGAIPFEYGFSTIARGIKPIFRIEESSATYIGSEENGKMIPLDVPHRVFEYPMGVTHIGHPISSVLWKK